MSRYIPGIQTRHPALTDRDALLRVMFRYDWRAPLAGASMGVTSETVMRALKRLAPDVVQEMKRAGKLCSSYSRSL